MFIYTHIYVMYVCIYIHEDAAEKFILFNKTEVRGIVCVCTYVCIHICTYICINMYVYINVCMYIYMRMLLRSSYPSIKQRYVCIYVYKYIYVCMYIYIYMRMLLRSLYPLIKQRYIMLSCSIISVSFIICMLTLFTYTVLAGLH
jgi:hypothetical protein